MGSQDMIDADVGVIQYEFLGRHLAAYPGLRITSYCTQHSVRVRVQWGINKTAGLADAVAAAGPDGVLKATHAALYQAQTRIDRQRACDERKIDRFARWLRGQADRKAGRPCASGYATYAAGWNNPDEPYPKFLTPADAKRLRARAQPQ
jgi:hypothetical protein